MPSKKDNDKPPFDKVRLAVYIGIACIGASYYFFRLSYMYNDWFTGLAIGLLVVIGLVLLLYKIDDGRRY